MNINFIITGLTRLGIKPESTATDACALAIRPSELFKVFNGNGSLLSFILAKLVLSDINSEKVFALSIVTASGVAPGGGGFGSCNSFPIEPQMTSYIIETVRTKCIIDEALKVRGQKYDKLSLKIVQKALFKIRWQLGA